MRRGPDGLPPAVGAVAAAATNLGAGPDCPVDPAELAALAARLERWVRREGQG